VPIEKKKSRSRDRQIGSAPLVGVCDQEEEEKTSGTLCGTLHQDQRLSGFAKASTGTATFFSEHQSKWKLCFLLKLLNPIAG
jgi:hypothetical protein